MDKNKTKNTLFILAAVAAMISGIWFGSYNQPQKETRPAKIQGVILPVAKTILPFNLTDHNEKQFTLENLKGHWSVLFLGYTQCPDICPAALNTLKQVHKLMTEQNLTPPQIVFISVDPERDTYTLLAEYVTYFNAKFMGVTGKQNQLKKLAQQLSVSFSKAPVLNKKTNKDYLMNHSSAFMLINPEGKLQSFLTAPHTPMQIIKSIMSSQVFYNEKHKD